jgi:polysaccharide pyruvyl transferase WcaK-like protein
MRASSDQHPRVVLLRNTFENLGDIAMLEAEISALLTYVPEARISVLTDDQRLTGKFPYVTWGEGDLVLSDSMGSWARSTVRRALVAAPRWIAAPANRYLSQKSARYRQQSIHRFVSVAGSNAARMHGRLPAGQSRFLDHLKRADLVIGGGGLIGQIPSICQPRRVVYEALRALRIPYVLNGLSLTSVWGDATYSGAALVVVRDKRSSKPRSMQCSVNQERLLCVIDPAFPTQPPSVADIDTQMEANGVQPNRFLAVNLRAIESELRDAAPLLRTLSEQVISIASLLRVEKVLLFGMQSFRENDDRLWITALQKHISSRIQTKVPLLRNPSELKALLSQARAVMSCRYHGVLFALASGVPALGLIPKPEYELKLRGLFHWYELDDLCFNLGETIPRAVLEIVTFKHELLAERIKERNHQLAQDVKRPYERIRDLLGLSK